MTKSRKSTRTTLLNILCFIGITLFGKVGFADATFTISSIEDTAIWPHVDAISINVHGSQGEWIETIPGDSNSWLAPKTGAYFFVALKKPDNTVLVTTANSSEENSASFSGPASKPISKTWSIATYTETNSQGSEVFSLSDSSWRQSQVLGAQSYYESNTLILDGYGVIRGDITKGNAVSLTMPRVFERSYFADDVNMTKLFLGQLLAISSDGSELIASAIDDAGASKLSTLLDVITNDGSQAYVSSISLADLFEPLDGQQFDLYGIQ